MKQHKVLTKTPESKLGIGYIQRWRRPRWLHTLSPWLHSLPPVRTLVRYDLCTQRIDVSLR